MKASTCESCHGPLVCVARPPHHAWRTHKIASPPGMYDTRNLIRRGKKCLSCHLGTQERFVNPMKMIAGPAIPILYL